MKDNNLETFNMLINKISTLNEVESIGKCGGKEFPASNESDIDIFVFCTAIPEVDKRESKIKEIEYGINNVNINAFEGELWGNGDFINVGDMEVCVMYFTIAKTKSYIESILNCEHLDRVHNYFYPTGRCATIKNMHILYEKNGFIVSMKERLSIYPAILAKKMIERHLPRLNDTEDLERAVFRKDVLFYHFALDISIDHFLQILFALNNCFFPSRKRTIEHIVKFDKAPKDCIDKLLKAVELGGCPDTIKQSFDIFVGLSNELADLINIG
jgi:hypothetical protein